ncbi:hypothetical protein ASPBRDRAFT_37544 [Aspergillus brasiliensis CBS 101740]|uniref:Histone H1 n=1 Tax=Aspergillus brasiliensis (strain CBS 101740 / IMI 381727 / IBT 21946) TaxID=767769 RepID=A0A1L9V334_ASPBC|nr:hypothetical protein ASPBRDRAFT_37544 [Aspergillus brasiliensis CBS 101740]
MVAGKLFGVSSPPPDAGSRSLATWQPTTLSSSRSRLTRLVFFLDCSRQSIKKYVQANNKIASASTNAFDSQFNKAIKAGVEKGEFLQPKGKSINPSRASLYYHLS